MGGRQRAPSRWRWICRTASKGAPAQAPRAATRRINETATDDATDLDPPRRPAQQSDLASAEAASSSGGPPASAAAPRAPAAAAVHVVESLLVMLHEAPSHWRHFPQFFYVLHEFARLGSDERELMLRKRVVSLLVDFYLGDESPLAVGDGPHHRPKRTRMGDKYTLPNLEHMLDLITTLVLSSARREPPAATPYSLEPLLRMHADEHAIATCEPFLAKLLKEGLNVRALEVLLLHTIHESRDCSMAPLATVLHGIDTMDSDALAPYLQAFIAMVTLEDSQHSWRVHRAMGKFLHVIANNMRFKLATIACLRVLITLASHDLPRQWLLMHHQHWIQPWLLEAGSDGVRCCGEQLIEALLAAEQAVADEDMVEPNDADWEGQVCEHLLSLMPLVHDCARELGPERGPNGQPTAKSLAEDAPPLRLAPYFRVLTWCARRTRLAAYEPPGGAQQLLELYDVQDGHHWECDEAKKALVQFWHAAALQMGAVDDVSPYLELAASPEGFSRILDSFVSLRPQERHVRFNSELLPAFYGLLRAALSFEPARAACISTLATHRNWEWAIRYILVESLDYANLLAGSLHPALNAPPEEGVPLSVTLLALLRPCVAFAQFRAKVLHAMLENRRLNFASPNVLVLLELLLESPDERAHACDCAVLPALTGVVDAAYAKVVGRIGHRPYEFLERLLRLIARLTETLTKVPRANANAQARRQRVVAAWGLAQPECHQPLLNALLGLLRRAHQMGPEPTDAPSPLPPPTVGGSGGAGGAGGGAAADDGAGSTAAPMIGPAPPPLQPPPQSVAPPPPPASALSAAYELMQHVAQLDGTCAHAIIEALLACHQREHAAADADAMAAAEEGVPQPEALAVRMSLAGLSPPHAQLAAHGRTDGGAQFTPYYEFAFGVLFASLTHIEDEEGIVGPAMLLTLTLFAETVPLPSVCTRFARFLRHAAVKCGPSHPIGRQLARQLGATGYGCLERALLDKGALHTDIINEACTEILKTHPPPDEWRERMRAEIGLASTLADDTSRMALEILDTPPRPLPAAAHAAAAPASAAPAAAAAHGTRRESEAADTE